MRCVLYSVAVVMLLKLTMAAAASFEPASPNVSRGEFSPRSGWPSYRASNEIVVRRSEQQTSWELQDSKDKSAVEQKASELTTWNLGITVMLLIVASIQAYLFIRQLKLMGDSLVESATAARAASSSAKLAEHGLRLAERPNLRIDGWRCDPLAVGRPARLCFNFNNSGRTPGEILEVTSGFGISEEDRIPMTPPDSSSRPDDFPGIAYPGGVIRMNVETPQLTAEEFADITSGRKVLAVYGRITLRDEFDWICEIGYGCVLRLWPDGPPTFTFINRRSYSFVRWFAPNTHPIDTGARQISPSLPIRYVCNKFLGTKSDRDDSLLQLHLTSGTDQRVVIDFHGDQITALQKDLNDNLARNPNIASWASNG
jgi:hypothetical protein